MRRSGVRRGGVRRGGVRRGGVRWEPLTMTREPGVRTLRPAPACDARAPPSPPAKKATAPPHRSRAPAGSPAVRRPEVRWWRAGRAQELRERAQALRLDVVGGIHHDERIRPPQREVVQRHVAGAFRPRSQPCRLKSVHDRRGLRRRADDEHAVFDHHLPARTAFAPSDLQFCHRPPVTIAGPQVILRDETTAVHQGLPRCTATLLASLLLGY